MFCKQTKYSLRFVRWIHRTSQHAHRIFCNIHNTFFTHVIILVYTLLYGEVDGSNMWISRGFSRTQTQAAARVVVT